MNAFLMLILYVLDVHKKRHKRTIQSGGINPVWKYTFAIDDKGGEIYQMQRIEAWFQGEQIYQMQRTEENLLDTEDIGMVPGGA
jgi:hypothetical protein